MGKIPPRLVLSHAGLLAILLALALAVLACVPQPAGLTTVTSIIDGDTIVVTGDIHVRYIGMDTPERDEPFYREATEANRVLVLGKAIRMDRDVSDKDRYGRLLRYVYAGDVFVNRELVRMGLARARAYPPDTRYQSLFEASEQEARHARRGMWKNS